MQTLPSAYVLIRATQHSGKRGTCVFVQFGDGTTKATTYYGKTGRNDAKREAAKTAKAYGLPLYNVKQGGRIVFCPMQDPFNAASGTVALRGQD